MGYYRPEILSGDIEKPTTAEQVALLFSVMETIGEPHEVLGEVLGTDPDEIRQWQKGEIFLTLNDPRREKLDHATEAVQDGLQRNLTPNDIAAFALSKFSEEQEANVC